jgi:hypothetical protein
MMATGWGIMSYEHDDSEWPIVVDRTTGRSDDEGLARYVAIHTALLARQTPYVSILDASQANLLHFEHRHGLASFISSHEEELRTYRAGMAIICKSSFVRGMVVATFWIKKPPYPYKVVTSLQAAKSWARQVLAGGPEKV